MKILFIQKMEGISGSENYYLHIMPKLKAAGINVKFLMLQPVNAEKANHEFRQILESHGIEVFSVTVKRFFSLSVCRYISKIVDRENIDIIQTNLIHADLYGALTKLLLNRKLKIISVKHGYDVLFQVKHGLNPKKVSKLNIYYLISRFSAIFANKIITISQALADLIIQSKITKDKKVQVIPYGFDFINPDPIAKEKHRQGNSQAIIIGRLIPVKQHNLVIELMPQILVKHPGFKLVLVGNGDLEDELKKQCLQLGVNDNVLFLGFKKMFTIT